MSSAGAHFNSCRAQLKAEDGVLESQRARSCVRTAIARICCRVQGTIARATQIREETDIKSFKKTSGNAEMQQKRCAVFRIVRCGDSGLRS